MSAERHISPCEAMIMLKIVTDAERLWQSLTENDDDNESNPEYQRLNQKLKDLYKMFDPSESGWNWDWTDAKIRLITDANRDFLKDIIDYKINQIRTRIVSSQN